jgi:hypothetical protein
MEGRYVETFLVESRLEHLRQHERVANADRVLRETVARFGAKGAPKVSHLIAAPADGHPARGERTRKICAAPQRIMSAVGLGCVKTLLRTVRAQD